MERPIEVDRYKANDAMLKKLLSGLNRLANTMHAMNMKIAKRNFT